MADSSGEPEREKRNPEQPDRRRHPRLGGRRAGDQRADWVSITTYAHCYGIDRVIVYKWLSAGILDFYKVGTITRIRNLPPDEHQAREQRPDVDAR